MMDLELIIGLETHIELSTARKLFCFCANDPFGSEPNAHVCPVCTGFPGQLPVLNAEAVERAVRLSLALGLTVNSQSVFARKNYFYPDLPMGYQISQYQEPLAEEGRIELEREDGTQTTVRIQRLHMENDAGKLTHGTGGTLLDFNRAGVPLVEIVTHPDLRSADDAFAYAKELQAVARAVGAADADMEKGMMRFDASVSLRPRGEDRLYPRAEIKNLNSFRSLRNAIAYEEQRQRKLWEAGEIPTKEMTVGWLDDEQKTVFLRWKESADDYRYFDEPDIPPLQIDATMLERVRAEVPELPHQRRARYVRDYGLDPSVAMTIAADANISAWFEFASKNASDPKAFVIVANWTTSIFNSAERNWSLMRIKPEQIGEFANLVANGTVSTTTAKEVLSMDEVFTGDVDPVEYIREHGLTAVQDEGAIEEACRKAITANPKAAEDVKAGQEKAMGVLIGLVMKETRGKADVATATATLKRLLSDG